LFVDGVFAFEKTAALKAAVELDVFSALQTEGGKLAPTAARIGAAERGVRILCDYLTVHGFLEKERGIYRLTPSTQTFLTRSSPAYMGGIMDFLAPPEMLALWLTDPAASVRNGGSVGLAATSPENPVWVKFARAMVPFMAPIAGMMATEVVSWPKQPKRVLDIAAGHGLFGITLAQAIPDLKVTALDWPAVLMVARENASAAKVAERYHTIEGSAFDVDWGTNYDLVLLANFLHHFDRDTCIGLLKHAKSVITSGGRLLAVEFVPNDNRVSPPMPAAFAYQMLASTPAGDAFTLKELQDMGLAAGFSRVTGKPAEPTPQTFVTFEP
jgi:hypothetical protein